MALNMIVGKCSGELNGAVAAWSLGLIEPLELPDLATRYLANGIDTPALRTLAGVTSTDAHDLSTLWEKALRELDCTVPDKHSAATIYARCVARLIVSGEISPYDGAQALWRASIAVGDPSFHKLDPFIYASSEYEERPADRAFFEEAIVKEAERWAARERNDIDLPTDPADG